MRFKGTWLLLLICLVVGCFIYFYEIKGGEEREKAKEAESRFWTLAGKDISQIELNPPNGEKIVAERKNQEEWIIRTPRTLEADSEELNRLADKAADLKFESALEETAPDPAQFGLDPAKSGFKIKTKDEKEYEVSFGDKNPAGNRIYTHVAGRNRIFLVSTSFSDTFDKKLDDLRNHSVLQFDKSEVQSMDIKNPKGTVHLVKDGQDRWWIEGKDRIAADSPAVRGILNAISLGRISEFFDATPSPKVNASLDKPRIDVSLALGKDKAIKRLRIGPEKAELNLKASKEPASKAGESPKSALYLAQDASRPELFFVDQDLVDKLDKSTQELRDKSLASFQRWDVDSIELENESGKLSFSKEGGEWFLGDGKDKAKFDAVNGILDALGSDAVEIIDKPAGLPAYGLDNPVLHVVLKQGDKVVADCSMGKRTDKGVYTRIKGDSAVKVASAEDFEKLNKDKAYFMESPKVPATGTEKPKE